MITEAQSKYISDLVVQKTKEFKEVKELLISNSIVGENAQIVADAQTLAEITSALDGLQASKLIDVLIATKPPARSTEYAPKRVQKTISTLEDIKSTINGWSF